MITLREMLLELKWAETTKYNRISNSRFVWHHKKWILCLSSYWKKHAVCLVKKQGPATLLQVWLRAWASKVVFSRKAGIKKLKWRICHSNHQRRVECKTAAVPSSHIWVYEVGDKSDSGRGEEVPWKERAEPQRGSADTQREWKVWDML